MKYKQTKNMLLAFAIMLAAPALILCQGAKKGGAEQEVRNTISDLATALGKNDTAALDRLYADEYTFIGDTGNMMTKAERIAAIKAGDIKYESISIAVSKIHLFGDTAVVVTNINSKFAPGSKITGGKFITTTTFVKIKGHWQLVAASNIRLAE